MDTFIRRQFAARSAVGDVSSLALGATFPYKLSDVWPRNILKLGSGRFTSDYIALDAGDTFSVPLPESYDNANRLACLFVASDILKVAVVDPSSLGSSTFLIKATNNSTKGVHPGVLSWQGRVTSITLTSPAALSLTVLVQYFLFNIPDLTDADSWRHGEETIGVVSQ